MQNTEGNVVILRGASGSGKSTYAREMLNTHPNSVIVSRDIIRQQFGLVGKGILPTEQERLVTKIEIDSLRRGIVQGQTVIVDDTNLDPNVVGKLIDECHLYGVEPKFKFFDPPLEALLERCKTSGVPEEVVRKHHSRGFPTPHIRVPLIEQLHNNFAKEGAFIFDIDGTLAHINPNSPRDIYDGSRVYQDLLDQSVSVVYNSLYEWDFQTLIVSGRDEKYRDVTEKWLYDNKVYYGRLYMRPKGDTRHDAAVKYEIAQRIVEDYNVLGVFDDRSRVVQMWRTAGFKTFQVADWIKSDF